MHGRLKVRSTAEQAEAKRQERQKKLKIYQKVTSKVTAKRQNDEWDEEALTLTGQLLIVNPDFYTLWNYRREVFQQLKKERDTSQIQELCTKELGFLESCLPVNPKSYGIWHHRSWTMLFMPEPDWKRELNLCNVYLGYDERNFHCWDYRRFVVEHAKVSAQEEFEFTSNKIKENFSNYSSWHYRSKLLPKIHPYSSENSERIEEKALLKEFELVQNAFFTDPNDQSAWFYHRWLLGRAKDDLGILLSYLGQTGQQVCLYLLFNQPVKLEKVLPIVLKLNESVVKGDWFNPFKNTQPSYIWMVEIINFSVSCEDPKFSIELLLERGEEETWHSSSDQVQYVFRSELTAVHSSFLENELESCQLLLEEEPNNKWTILTIVLLMRAINPMKYTEEVEEHVKRLCVVDPYRREYYCDLEVDLSKNKLPKLDDCNVLQCAKKLIVDDNKLVTVAKRGTLNLPYLETLSLNNNNITTVACLRALQGCKNLQKLYLHDNPVTTLPNWRQEIRTLLPWLKELNGEQL